MNEPEYNKIICTLCRHVATYMNRAHECPSTPRYHILTVYAPNIGKVTRNADPTYRKHAGSRPKRFRRTAAWKFIEVDLRIAAGV